MYRPTLSLKLRVHWIGKSAELSHTVSTSLAQATHIRIYCFQVDSNIKVQTVRY